MSTWGVPINMLMIEAGVDYAIEFCEGRTNSRFDKDVLFASINKVDSTCEISNYEDAEGVIDNYFLLLCDFYDFSK